VTTRRGRAFQKRAPATGKARSPIVESCVRHHHYHYQGDTTSYLLRQVRKKNIFFSVSRLLVSGPSYHDNAGRGIDDYDCFRSIAVTNDNCRVNNASSSSRVGNGDDNHFRFFFNRASACNACRARHCFTNCPSLPCLSVQRRCCIETNGNIVALFDILVGASS